MINAVVFDLDGVLVDSEQVWDEVRRDYVAARGGRWTSTATADMQGMSSLEWSAYIADELGIDADPTQINADVVAEMHKRYEQSVPFLPGAVEAVERIAQRWPLGLASSSNRPIIDQVLETGGIGACFRTTLSTEEIAAGKPAPDVYTEVCRRLDVEPADAAAIEDSTNGLRAASAAGMRVVAIPNAVYPPDNDVLETTADVVLGSIRELTAGVVEPAEGAR